MNPLSRVRLEKVLPPNVSAEDIRISATLGLTAGTIASLVDFFTRYSRAREMLYSTENFRRILIPYAKIRPYSQMTGATVIIFAMLAVLALASAALMYASFYQGGRSIYLMRRLPDSRRALRRYVWSAPLRLALTAVLWGLGLLVLYYLIWRFATPPQCLVPAFDGLFPTVIVD